MNGPSRSANRHHDGGWRLGLSARNPSANARTGLQVGQVEMARFEARARVIGGDLRDGAAALLLISHREDHVPAPAGQRPGGRQAETAVGSGDDEHAAGPIFHATHHVAGGTQRQGATQCLTMIR
jgi:hypothetical protein